MPHWLTYCVNLHNCLLRHKSLLQQYFLSRHKPASTGNIPFCGKHSPSKHIRRHGQQIRLSRHTSATYDTYSIAHSAFHDSPPMAHIHLSRHTTTFDGTNLPFMSYICLLRHITSFHDIYSPSTTHIRLPRHISPFMAYVHLPHGTYSPSTARIRPQWHISASYST